jgi:RNA polymerase-binding protein DksA
MLWQRRIEIIGSVNEMHDEALKNSRTDAAGDLSSMPIHMADLGSDTFEQEFALGLMDSERKLLHEIDDALRRIDEKTYGICEATGKPIKKARLEAQPWARYCVEYARKLEQGKVTETQY